MTISTTPTTEFVGPANGRHRLRKSSDLEVTIAEVNRVLEVGRLLLSVLTYEELDQLRQELSCGEETMDRPP